jgi:hypothetical protein
MAIRMDIDWIEFATTLDKIETVASFFLLLIVLKLRGYNSIGISLSAWVFGNLMMEFIADGYLALSLVNDASRLWVRHAWYVTWIVSYCIMLRFIGDMHRARQVEPGIQCKLIAAVILILAILQLVRYIDRLIFETDVLGAVYKWSVLSLNMLPFMSISIKTLHSWMKKEIKEYQ